MRIDALRKPLKYQRFSQLKNCISKERKAMGLIYKDLALKGEKGDRIFHALWDNGSSECFIRGDLAEKVTTISKLRIQKEFEMGKGTLPVRDSTPIVDIEVEGYNLFWHFLVVPNLSEELIIGADFLQRWKIKLDPESEKIIIDPRALKLKLVYLNSSSQIRSLAFSYHPLP